MMKAQWMLILTLIFALITAIFAVINVDPVRVNFLVTQADIPLILVVLGSTLLGGLIASLLGMLRQFKLKRTIRQLEKRVSELEREQAESAAAPVPASPDSQGTAARGTENV
ncbi:lipopolysaccharide assembly protein LapA domain-containing protein [Paenibacillus validus]|nr:lipopolysaccharide assembly protein LapA domain-containing protein [Paenibacillus validus]MED4602505.1 lipopolysaccharide assembly protein LapA domain-containing protein [Paenibacillus validus]MED4608337.1 lipopolysaccharide assembly protein LapA domain-containing protein [Paenibacillus validus]